ncbi:MAG: [FeFe] hydrogenase H-cluster maturation GTPase HydF, partial [Fenollaria timonensis]
MSLLAGLVDSGATIVMVMPQDAAAPKGRLIKAQVEAIREALDKGMTSIV